MDQPLRTPRSAHPGRRLGFLLLLPALAFTALLTSASAPAPGRTHYARAEAARALDAAARGGRGAAPADASAAHPAAARALAAVLTATKTDNRALSSAVAGGATINYTVTLANTGDAAATGVNFSDTIDPNTTLAGAIRVSPLAFSDAYGFLIGSPLVVMAGTGLKANDFVGAPAAPVTAFSLNGFATTHAAGTTAPVSPGGSLTVNADGSFTFTPPAGFSGVFTFQYRLANVAGTDTATVTLTSAAPVAPTAVADGPAPNSAPGDPYHTAFNTPFALAAPGVLTNDGLGTPTATLTSFGGGSLGGSVTDHAAGSNVALGGGGSLQVGANGAVAFTPPTGFTGPFTFQYRLTNAAGTSDATVTIAVGARPAAANDTYPYVLVGNVPIDTASDTGFSVSDNDAGDGATLSVSSTSNGTVVLNPSGTFTFEPAPGYEGPAGFTYDRTNGFGTVSASVSLSVSGVIWFIDNAASPGVGTLTSPFNSVAAFTAVNDGAPGHPAAGDDIFLYERAAPYVGPLTLLNGQVAIGQDATASLAAITGLAPPPDSPALPATDAGNPTTATLAGASGGVTLAQNNALYGLTVAPTGGTGIAGAGFGTLTVDDVTVNAGGGAALDLTNGSLDAAFDGVSSTGGTHGVALTGVGGTADLGTGALSGSTTAAFLVSGGNATLSYAGSITNTVGRAVSATSRTGGALTLAGPITETGAGLLVQNNTGGSVSFT
ncbi:MAG TPA: cadherin-like domain-containing protein, partial [Rhodothermales bacterium]|nr:cadherin-like domain-containing protein [Rhodothermales bacterium]